MEVSWRVRLHNNNNVKEAINIANWISEFACNGDRDTYLKEMEAGTSFL